MKKINNLVLIFVPILLVIIVGLILIFVHFGKSGLPKTVTITKYNLDTNEVIKEVVIDDKEKIKELYKHIKVLRPITEGSIKDYELDKEIILKYDDSITVSFKENVEKYCYYVNKDENISSIARLTKTLYNFVINELK